MDRLSVISEMALIVAVHFNTAFGETAYQVKATHPRLFIEDIHELSRRCDGPLSEDYRIVKQLADDSVQRGGIQYITRHKVQELVHHHN